MYQNMESVIASSNLPVLDLRSDTVTKPTAAMREAMHHAEVGDDVYGEDPSINKLEEFAANLLGKESALFLPSSTMSNLLAMLAHTSRGDEIILGADYHINAHEAGGSSIVGGTFPCQLPLTDDGGLDPALIEAAIKPDDSHYPPSRVLSLENTVSGQAVPMARINACLDVADKYGLKKHLDGARFFNAITKLGIAPTDLAARFDTINICLSKGLGAPVGAVLVGDTKTIKKARRDRKFLGGGMRQAGILAAAGLFAFQNNIERLQEDHDRAAKLATVLRQLPNLNVTHQDNQTNMVFINPTEQDAEPLRAHLAARGINIAGGTDVRMVIHLEIDDEGLERIIDGFSSYFQN